MTERVDWSVPAGALDVLRTLEAAGHEAWLVGGCVRDMLRGAVPGDWDIAVSAVPEQVLPLFEKAVPTGLAHGTVTVLWQGVPYEVTTFREETGYTDHRRPDGVRFVKALQADLARRDFTINAMAWHPDRGLRDPFGGRDDLAGAVIRAVGVPAQRFREDALRMLRAIRFAAQLDFDIAEETLAAIGACAADIRHVSRERARVELDKWLLAPHPSRRGLLRSSGLMHFLLPELDRCFDVPQNTPWHRLDVGGHTLEAVAAAPPVRTVRWALLLHDLGKAETRTTDAAGTDHFNGHGPVSEKLAEQVLERFRWDRATKEAILNLVRHHDRFIAPEPRAVRRALHTIGEEAFSDWLAVRRADLRAQAEEKAGALLTQLDAVEGLWQAALAAADCLTVKRLALNGRDLLALGVAEGPEIGRLLHLLLEQVLDEPALNERETLVALLNPHIEQKT